jgi:Tfp pilus assembly protein PilO
MNNRILPSLSLIIAVAAFFMYVSPTWSGSIAATKAAIANDDQALSAASQYVAEQNQLATERDAIDPTDLARVTAFLPDSVDNVGLILDLNALAAHSGLSLANIDVVANSSDSSRSPATGSAGASPLGSVDLSLSAIGTYAALQNFLRGVERSRRLVDIRDLIVRGSDTGVYNYQMVLRLYWLR